MRSAVPEETEFQQQLKVLHLPQHSRETSKPITCANPHEVSAVVQAEIRLRHSAYSELRMISCEFDGGTLSLKGRVPSYFLKQMAQAVIGEVAGVRRIDNQLSVYTATPRTRRV